MKYLIHILFHKNGCCSKIFKNIYWIIFTFFRGSFGTNEKSIAQNQVELNTEQDTTAATTSNSSKHDRLGAIFTETPETKTLPRNNCEAIVRDWGKCLRSSTRIKSSCIVARSRKVPKIKLKRFRCGDEEYYKLKN